MPNPRITVGVPLYKGADLVATALDCLQRQTFGDFEVIISVDGNDTSRLPPAAPFWLIHDSAWSCILSDWTGSAISTGFYSRI